MNLVTSTDADSSARGPALRWVLCLAVAVVLGLASGPQALAKQMVIAPPPEDESAATTMTIEIDTTLIETSDWGELPREAIWDKDMSVMVLVPAGEFTMGINDPLDKGGRIQEGPAHKVILSSYYIDKHEVTNRQYQEFCKQTGHIRPRVTPGHGLRDPDKPVVSVTWEDAMDYARWAGKELPTEAQWEKAARSDQRLTYPWGDEWVEGAANTKEAGLDTTAPPGTYPKDKSPYGIMDMAGNVAEWVADWYDRDYYAKSPDTNPTGPEEGVFSRTVRGGDYYYDKQYARLTDRRSLPPNQSREEYGFRCVRVLKVEPTPTPAELVSRYMPPTPTPVVNPFAPLEPELYKAWENDAKLPLSLSPVNVGRQSPVTFINGLPIDIDISILDEEPQVVIYNETISALGRKEIRLGVDKAMALYVRIPKLGRIARVEPTFQSDSRPVMILKPGQFLRTVVDPSGKTELPPKNPEMTIYYEMPKLQWNLVKFYNDASTTVSLHFQHCPVVDCASDETTAELPYTVFIGPRDVWKASVLPGRHSFDIYYLGSIKASTAPKEIEVNDRLDHRGVIIQENTQTNERVRVFARELPPLEARVIEQLIGPYVGR